MDKTTPVTSNTLLNVEKRKGKGISRIWVGGGGGVLWMGFKEEKEIGFLERMKCS